MKLYWTIAGMVQCVVGLVLIAFFPKEIAPRPGFWENGSSFWPLVDVIGVLLIALVIYRLQKSTNEDMVSHSQSYFDAMKGKKRAG